MSTLLANTIGQVSQSALAMLEAFPSWPDPMTGFAYQLFAASSRSLPNGFSQPLKTTTAQLLRRSPELAAFGFVITKADTETQANWVQAFDRLVGRDPYPSDRNSFVHNLFELLGIAFGVKNCDAVSQSQRDWLISTIECGVRNREFLDCLECAAAICAVGLVDETRLNVTAALQNQLDPTNLTMEELLLLTGMAYLYRPCISFDIVGAESEIARRALLAGVAAQDTAEAAALCISLSRVLERAALEIAPNSDPVSTITALCRRFQLFIDRLQARQRHRTPYHVQDEYDVQDLLHAILKLHFDDIRPEEWTPRYAGNSSRVDFFLPRERTIIEAKMTRSGLGQKEVANELIIDVARYAKMTHVDYLVCLVYDPERRCINPSALEADLGESGGRLSVHVIVCPRGI